MSDLAAQQLMLKAARLYYEDGRTQEEVSHLLHVSRPTVSRLIQQAREEGIVQIKIVDPSSTHSQLELQLLSTFNLTDAVVINSEGDTHDLTRSRLGQAAARYLERAVTNGGVVGMGWGRTMYEVVSALEPKRKARVTVVPLIGGLGQIAPIFQVHELARALAEKFGGTWQNFYVPALVESDKMAADLLRSADMRQALALWNEMTVAVVGIGNVDLASEIQMLFVNYLDDNTQTRLRSRKAVGDICVRFFDVNGKACANAVRGVVGVDLTQLRKAKRVIGVAGGAAKAEAILGALRGRYVNVLITDDLAAQRVLELHTQSKKSKR
ncbi:MAG: sugar-binding transcriptional regulator [Chloroflexi bacterium]|nr:sugar-binding transcriptional regulator [Chloroflexota bacterium]